MRAKTRAGAAVALVLAALATGCSPPGVAATASTSATTIQSSNEVPTPVPRPTAPGVAGPVLAIEAFATGYINWRADTVARTMHSLEAISIGQARSEVALAASETAQDYELRHGGVANSGTVEAVAPLLGHRDQYAVITRERTTATNTSAYQGLAPAWHLSLASVSRLANGRWAVSSWQPES